MHNSIYPCPPSLKMLLAVYSLTFTFMDHLEKIFSMFR